MFVLRFLDKDSADFEKIYNFGKADSSVSSAVFSAIRHFLLLDPEKVFKLTRRRLGITARSLPIGWARQNAAPLKFDPKPSEAVFSAV